MAAKVPITLKQEEPPAEPAFLSKEVVQFTFNADNDLLSCIYRALANKGLCTRPPADPPIPGPCDPKATSVNLAANYQVYDCELDTNKAVIVPGSDSTTAEDPLDTLTQSDNDLKRTRKVLKQYCVAYCEEKVLYVLAGPVTGVIARIQSVLNAAGVQILQNYNVENGFSIYQVDDNAAAQEALGKTAEEQNAEIEKLPSCKKLRCKNCKKHKKSKKSRHSHKHCDCKDSDSSSSSSSSDSDSD